MLITNFKKHEALLGAETTTKSPNVTNPLKVVMVEDNAVVVESSKDSDLLIKLNGITGVTVGSTITVNMEDGTLTVVDLKPVAAPAKASPSKGSSDRSAIVR